MTTTQTAQHTQSEWHIVGGGTQLTTIVSADGPGKVSHIARLHPEWMTSRDSDEVWANARLIAAAPELLEALERLADCHEAHSDGGICNEDHFELGLVVGVAIAKARGQS